MMELLPEDFSTAVRRTDHAESAAAPSGFLTDVQLETLDIDGTLTLCFRSGHAIVNFSVFPSHYYLYGFEVERSQRGKGYGTSFLQTVLVGLFSDTENLLTDLYTGRTVSDTPVAVSSLSLIHILISVTDDCCLFAVQVLREFQHRRDSDPSADQECLFLL